eukprot:gene14597-10437_t
MSQPPPPPPPPPPYRLQQTVDPLAKTVTIALEYSTPATSDDGVESVPQREENVLPLVHGVPYPKFCTEERWTSLDQQITYRDSDILIVSYPKCGTTWAEQVVLLLLAGGDTTQMDPKHKNCYDPRSPSSAAGGKLWIEAAVEQAPQVEALVGKEAAPVSLAAFDTQMPAPRVLKTHAPPSLLVGAHRRGLAALPRRLKVLVITRNPLDACVSCYYHPTNSPAKRGWPFAAWAETWFSGAVPHGNYFDWLAAWHAEAQRYPDQALWLPYEALHQDAPGQVEKVARFVLNTPPSTASAPASAPSGGGGSTATATTTVDPALIQRVVQASSFDQMKEQAQAAGGDHLGHLRRGTVGDWVRHFDTAPSALLDTFVAKAQSPEYAFLHDQLHYALQQQQRAPQPHP